MLSLLTGEIQPGQTRWLRGLIDELQERGVPLEGVLAPGVWKPNPDKPNGFEKLGIDNVMLPGGETVPFARRRDLAPDETSKMELQGMPADMKLVWAFSDEAIEQLTPESYDYVGLCDILPSQKAVGSTNIEDALKKSAKMLEGAKGSKAIVLMSDGMPNCGKEGAELVEYANELKREGITLYTVGFFNDLTGSELSSAQGLMEGLASDGYHFEATSGNVEEFFAQIAEQLSGTRYALIRVACPVDVTVVSDGEVLSSACDQTLTSSFGSVTLTSVDDGSSSESSQADGDDESDTSDKVKIVRIKQGSDFEVYVNGTGKGSMDYSISYMGADGKFTDERSFSGVPVSKGALIQSNTAQTDSTTLDIDSDGDGVVDERWRTTAKGSVTKVAPSDVAAHRMTALVAGVGTLTLLVGVVEYRLRRRRACA